MSMNSGNQDFASIATNPTSKHHSLVELVKYNFCCVPFPQFGNRDLAL